MTDTLVLSPAEARAVIAEANPEMAHALPTVGPSDEDLVRLAATARHAGPCRPPRRGPNS